MAANRKAQKKYADASSGVPLEVKNQRYLIIGITVSVIVIVSTSVLYYFAVNLDKQSDESVLVEDFSADLETIEEPEEEAEVRLLQAEDTKLQILNASGISGLAGETSGQFEELGYNVDIGNAERLSETQIIASKKYSKEELLEILEDIKEIVGKDTVDDYQDIEYDLKILLAEDQS